MIRTGQALLDVVITTPAGRVAQVTTVLLTLLVAAPVRAQEDDLAAALAAFAERRLDGRDLGARIAASGPDGLARVARRLRAGEAGDPDRLLPVLMDVPGGPRVVGDLLRDERLAAPALEALAGDGPTGLPLIVEAIVAPGVAPRVRRDAARAASARLRPAPSALAPWRARLEQVAIAADDADAASAALRLLVDVDGWDAVDVLQVCVGGPSRRAALTVAADLGSAPPRAGARERLQRAVVAIVTSPAAAALDRGLAMQALERWGDPRCVAALAPVEADALASGGAVAPGTTAARTGASGSDPGASDAAAASRTLAAPLDWTGRRAAIVAIGACLATLAATRARRRRHVRTDERDRLLAALQTARRARLAQEGSTRADRDPDPGAPGAIRRPGGRGAARSDGATTAGAHALADALPPDEVALREGIGSLRASEEAAAGALDPDAVPADERARLLHAIVTAQGELEGLRARLTELDALAPARDGPDDDEPADLTTDVASLRSHEIDLDTAGGDLDDDRTQDVARTSGAGASIPDAAPRDLTVDVGALAAPTAAPPTRAPGGDRTLRAQLAEFLEADDPDDTVFCVSGAGKAPSDDLRGAPPISPAEFQVVGTLGRGSQGSVWEARDPQGRAVALKLLPCRAGDEDARRLAREAELCRRIDSPHVVRVHGVHTAQDGRRYLSMELVRGRSALELQHRAGQLPVADVLRIGEHVARALVATAALGVVHRDVKPSNIVVAEDGTAKLLDFGIGKEEGAVTGLTRTGVGMGTLHYMAPEQLVDARSATTRSDVYALGATLYHLLTGRPVVHGEVQTLVARSLADLVRQVVRRRPAASALRPDCPPALERLIDRMLAETPAERPTAAEALAALERLRLERPESQGTSRSPTDTPPSPERARFIAAT